MEFFENLQPLLKAFWYIAIPASIIFTIQTILTFIGMDGSDGVEPDFDGDLGASDAPFQLFSLRNLINFLLGFSWTGISLNTLIENPFILTAVAFSVGVGFVLFFFYIIKQIQKLSEDNSFRLVNTLNHTAQVYLHIPANRTGKGKILVSVKGSMHELDAVTENQKIESGEMVKIIGILNNDLLKVEKI